VHNIAMGAPGIFLATDTMPLSWGFASKTEEYGEIFRI